MALSFPSTEDEALAMVRSPPPPLDQATVLLSLPFNVRLGPAAIELAVKEGVLDPNIQMPGEQKLIHSIAGRPGFVPLLQYLIIDRGLDPNEQAGNDQQSPLHIAINYSRQCAALFLINDVPGVDLEARRKDGLTPLMLAAARGMVEVMKALVANGADVDARNGRNLDFTAMAYAIFMKQEEAAIFLQQEANASWRVTDGPTAASLAAMFDCLPVLKTALRRMRADGVDEAAMARHMGSHVDEAAARRARNEKRRQKQKKAKARRRTAAAGGEEAQGGIEEEEQEEKQAEAGESLAGGMGALSVPSSEAAAGDGGKGLTGAGAAFHQGQQEQEKGDAPATTTAAAAAAAAAAADVPAAPPTPPPERPLPLHEYLEAHTPDHLVCPISFQLMEDPVLLAGDGCPSRGPPSSSTSTSAASVSE
jgi:hypothetical protein